MAADPTPASPADACRYCGQSVARNTAVGVFCPKRTGEGQCETLPASPADDAARDAEWLEWICDEAIRTGKITVIPTTAGMLQAAATRLRALAERLAVAERSRDAWQEVARMRAVNEDALRAKVAEVEQAQAEQIARAVWAQQDAKDALRQRAAAAEADRDSWRRVAERLEREKIAAPPAPTGEGTCSSCRGTGRVRTSSITGTVPGLGGTHSSPLDLERCRAPGCPGKVDPPPAGTQGGAP